MCQCCNFQPHKPTESVRRESDLSLTRLRNGNPDFVFQIKAEWIQTALYWATWLTFFRFTNRGKRSQISHVVSHRKTHHMSRFLFWSAILCLFTAFLMSPDRLGKACCMVYHISRTTRAIWWNISCNVAFIWDRSGFKQSWAGLSVFRLSPRSEAYTWRETDIWKILQNLMFNAS